MVDFLLCECAPVKIASDVTAVVGCVQVNEKGQVVAKSQLLKELGSLEEETGLKCCICLEGYRSHPQKV